MSTTKQYLKGNTSCKVRFKVTGSMVDDAATCSIVGDFNNWDAEANPMKKLKDGSFSAALNLDAPATYQFRYLVNGNQWITDAEADGVAEGPYPDAQNAVINL